MVENILTGWNFMRWLRLGLGLFVAFQAVQLHDALAGLVAAFFLFQAVTNTGCCGVGGCSIPSSKSDDAGSREVDYEEIKSTRE